MNDKWHTQQYETIESMKARHAKALLFDLVYEISDLFDDVLSGKKTEKAFVDFVKQLFS